MWDCTRMVDPFLHLLHLGRGLLWHPYRVEHLRLCIPIVSENTEIESSCREIEVRLEGLRMSNILWVEWTSIWLIGHGLGVRQWQLLTSHFSRISGQFLRISSRVYNAGGAVSSARPLVISHCTKQVMIPHLARTSRPQGQATTAKQMWKEITKTGGKKDSPVIT